MNELQTFSYGTQQVRTVIRSGEPWWVLADVCKALELTNPRIVAERLDDDEKRKSDLRLPGGDTWIINEPGLYSVILRSDKPQAKSFKRWITHEVLPSIRKTGSYSTTQSTMTDYQQMMAETRRLNVAVSKARLLNKIAEEYEGTFRQVLQAHATKELTGEFLLPLPQLPEKTYSAGEIGEILGISGQMVGILTNRHGLKTERYGFMVQRQSQRPYQGSPELPVLLQCCGCAENHSQD